MKKNQKKILRKTDNSILAKELLFSFLAVLSVGLLLWEILDSPTPEQQKIVYGFDVVVAFIFLADYAYLLHGATDKWYFVRHNWFLLLASVPLTTSWAEALKAFRLLVFVRLFRAGEHVYYAQKIVVESSQRKRRSGTSDLGG